MLFRVLVVDDEPLTRSFLAQKIPSLDGRYAVAACLGDGEEAMDFLLANGPVDLVLTDIKMPVMDGLELSRQIRARFPDLPVVILSGFGDFDFAQQAIQNGVSDYLLKPIVNVELTQLLSVTAERAEKSRQKRSEQERADRLLKDAVGWITCQYYQLSLLEQGAEAEATREMLHTLGAGPEEAALLCMVSLEPLGLEALMAGGLAQNAARRLRDVALRLAGLGQGWVFEDDQGNPVVLLPGRDCLDGAMAAEIAEMCAGQLRVASVPVAGDMTPRRAWRRAKTALLAPGGEAYIPSVLPEGRRVLKGVERAARDIAAAAREDCEPHIRRFFALCREVYGAAFSPLSSGALAALILAGPDPGVLARLSGAPPDAMLQRVMALAAACAGEAAEDFPQEHAGVVEAAKAYIHKNYQEPISLSMTAEAIGVSPGYLSGLFHKAVGEPYIKYLTRVRMEAAAKYLGEHPGMLVSDIAQKTGYIATKHFLYVFKKYFGLTPTEYRQSKKSFETTD